MPERIADTLVDMVKHRIPSRFSLDPIRDIQVLAPMNRGSLGIRELNARLQAELNPAKLEEPVVEKFGWQFRIRDKVIQTENDYDKEVFNGDIGQVVKLNPVQRESRSNSIHARSFMISASWTSFPWPTPLLSTNHKGRNSRRW